MKELPKRQITIKYWLSLLWSHQPSPSIKNHSSRKIRDTDRKQRSWLLVESLFLWSSLSIYAVSLQIQISWWPFKDKNSSLSSFLSFFFLLLSDFYVLLLLNIFWISKEISGNHSLQHRPLEEAEVAVRNGTFPQRLWMRTVLAATKLATCSIRRIGKDMAWLYSKNKNNFQFPDHFEKKMNKTYLINNHLKHE